MVEKLLELKKQGSFDVFNGCIDSLEAKPNQSVSALLWLYQRKGCFFFDTGLGKTITMIMTMQLLKNAYPNARFLLIVKKLQVPQVLSEIKSFSNFSVVWCNASLKVFRERMLNEKATQADIIMISHESLQMEDMQEYLTVMSSTFLASYIDEAHYMSNYAASDRAYFLASLNRSLQYTASLTATPIISKLEQLTWTLFMTDKQHFRNTEEINRRLTNGEKIDEMFPMHIYNFDRESLGIANTYRPHIISTQPHSFHLEHSQGVIYQTTRGRGSFNQTSAVSQIMMENIRQGRRGLIYVHYRESRHFLAEQLTKDGFNFKEISGETNTKQDKEAKELFNDGKLDFLIISVREALNLDCDYIVIYEATVYLKQVLGRAERGYFQKTIDIYFLFAENTGEREYFARTILPVCAIVQTALGRDYSRFLPNYKDIFLEDEGSILI